MSLEAARAGRVVSPTIATLGLSFGMSGPKSVRFPVEGMPHRSQHGCQQDPIETSMFQFA